MSGVRISSAHLLTEACVAQCLHIGGRPTRSHSTPLTAAEGKTQEREDSKGGEKHEGKGENLKKLFSGKLTVTECSDRNTGRFRDFCVTTILAPKVGDNLTTAVTTLVTRMVARMLTTLVATLVTRMVATLVTNAVNILWLSVGRQWSAR